MSRRTCDIPSKLLVACTTCALVAASVVLFTVWPRSIIRFNPAKVTPTSTPQPGSSPAQTALEVAVAFNAVDYRNAATWLETLRPMVTNRALTMLQTIYVPMSWSLFEKAKRIIPKDRIVASHLGVLAEGPDWQVHLVGVEIADPPTASDSPSFEMRILLKREKHAWKLDSLLTQSEVAAMLKAVGEEGR